MTSNSDNDALAEELKKHGVDLATVVRETHADTMIRVASLLEETFELALRKNMLTNGQKINEHMFKGNGELGTLAKKIDKAGELKLLDDVAFADAHLARKIRNKFAHRTERLHFDSGSIVGLARELSTYEKAEFNQDAILTAVSKVVSQLKSS